MKIVNKVVEIGSRIFEIEIDWSVSRACDMEEIIGIQKVLENGVETPHEASLTEWNIICSFVCDEALKIGLDLSEPEFNCRAEGYWTSRYDF